jgi:DNA polymerase
MPRTIIVDFETYYDKDYSLRKPGMSYPQFIHDKRFHVFGMSVDSGQEQYWVPAHDIPTWLNTHKDEILVAHNGFFDFAVMAWHYKFIPAYMVDTLLMANHVLGSARDKGGSRNDLGSLAERLGLKPKGRVEFMAGVRYPTEEQMRALIAYATNDAALARQVLNRLLPQFTNQDFEFWLMDHTIRIYLTKPLRINPEKLKNVKSMVEKRQAELIAAAGVPRSLLASDKQFAAHITGLLKTHKVRVPMKRAAKPRKDGTQPMIPALSKGDPAYIALTEHPVAEIANLVKARLVVRSAATVASRLATMQKYIDLGIGIPVHLVYYGAHTGRFSGGGGFNWQNLTNPDRAQDEIDKLIAGMIRDAVEAGDGKVFVEVDAAQIEARVLAWLAGEEDLLQDFAAKVDLYSKFIGGVLGEEVRKPTDAEKKDATKKDFVKHLLLMRDVGKKAVLGLGYQMGADKFLARLRADNRELAKIVDSGVITLDMAKNIVKSYRDSYQEIVSLWTALDRAFHRARQGIIAKVGPVTFKRIGVAAVACILPSGRALYYRNIRQEKRKTQRPGKFGKPGDEMEWKHGSGQKIYGGLLTENIVQAISRDVLVEAVLAAEQAGYPVALHVHDSVVGNVVEAQGQEAMDFLVKTLSTPPAWGQGMVLSAEGHFGRSMGK